VQVGYPHQHLLSHPLPVGPHVRVHARHVGAATTNAKRHNPNLQHTSTDITAGKLCPPLWSWARRRRLAATLAAHIRMAQGRP